MAWRETRRKDIARMDLLGEEEDGVPNCEFRRVRLLEEEGWLTFFRVPLLQSESLIPYSARSRQPGRTRLPGRSSAHLPNVPSPSTASARRPLHPSSTLATLFRPSIRTPPSPTTTAPSPTVPPPPLSPEVALQRLISLVDLAPRRRPATSTSGGRPSRCSEPSSSETSSTRFELRGTTSPLSRTSISPRLPSPPATIILTLPPIRVDGDPSPLTLPFPTFVENRAGKSILGRKAPTAQKTSSPSSILRLLPRPSRPQVFSSLR